MCVFHLKSQTVETLKKTMLSWRLWEEHTRHRRHLQPWMPCTRETPMDPYQVPITERSILSVKPFFHLGRGNFAKTGTDSMYWSIHTKMTKHCKISTSSQTIFIRTNKRGDGGNEEVWLQRFPWGTARSGDENTVWYERTTYFSHFYCKWVE